MNYFDEKLLVKMASDPFDILWQAQTLKNPFKFLTFFAKRD